MLNRIRDTFGKTVIRCGLTMLSGLLLSSFACGGEPPSVSYIFPAGGQRGTTVDIRVGGHYLHEECPFELLGESVKGSPTLLRTETVWFEGPVIPLPDSQRKEDYPKDQAGKIEIASDAEPGIRFWRVWTSQGATTARKFVVGTLPEIVEDEISGNPIPVAVSLPLTINGRIFPREDIDIWTVDLQAGELVTCEVMAARIGSPLQSKLEVRDPHGRRIAENLGALSGDSWLRFTAETAGKYEVRIHDVEFSGLQDYVYRLTLTKGTYVDRVFPLGGQRGKTTSFELSGQQIPVSPIDVTLPTSPASSHWQNFTTGSSDLSRVLIELDDFSEYREMSIPKDPVSLPAVLNGRISQAAEVDVWQVAGTKGTTMEFDVRAARLGSPLDSVLVIKNADGKELAKSDDFAAKQTDSRQIFTFPEDGIYTLEVSERIASRGGPEFAYRLRISPAPAPGFRVTLPADAISLERGAEVKLKVTCERTGGFTGEIKLSAEGLPDGVTLTGDVIAANKNDTQLVIKADETTRIDAYHPKFKARGMIADAEVVTNAHVAPLGDAEPESLLLVVGMPTPFKFKGIFETKYAPRGATFQRHYTIERGDYEGPFEVSLADRQFRHLQGVTGPKMTIPAGATEFDYPVYLPPWMEIGRTSRTVLALVAEIPDETGRKHKVSYSSGDQADQIIILVDPGALSVDIDRRSMRTLPGETAELSVTVGRGQELAKYPVKVELIHADHVKGVATPPLELGAGESSGKLTLQFGDATEMGPFNAPFLVRATCQTPQGIVVAETSLTLVSPDSASSR